MDIALYNKISIAYQNLSDRFHNYDKKWDKYYAVYNKEFFIVRDERLEFLKQFQEISYGAFFKKKHIESNYYGEEYLSLTCVKVTEHEVRIHDNFAQVLFYYLIKYFQNDIKTLLQVLTGPEINDKFKYDYKIEEGEFKFNPNVQEAIYTFIKERVPNYKLIFHLFAKTNSNIIYADYDAIVINIKTIERQLKNLDEIFDFKDFEIK
jgi:hypothetical protein